MANELLGVWGTVGSVALAILVLLAMITVHEFGHYLAGRLLHFKIDEFSIGFGPALFKRRSKKTGELFAVRLIPLGGYCAFAGEDGAEAPPAEPFTEVTAGSLPSAAQQASPSSAEGPSSPHPASSEEKDASPPRAAPSEEEKKHWFVNRKPWQRMIVLAAGAVFNYLAALLLIIVCFFAYGQTMIAVYEVSPAEGIGAEYCLQDKDILLSAEGKPLYLVTDVAKALNGKKAGERVRFRVSRLFMDEKGESRREETDVLVQLRADAEVKNSADLDCVWEALGVAREEDGYLLANASYRFGFWETLGRAFVYSFKIAGSVLKILGELLTGRLGLSALGGPVSTIAITSQVAGRSLKGFLEIAGYIGVNLAVFNLLPVPALDGCKIVFTLIEWIRKKPLNRKAEAAIHFAGLVFLLGFAVLVDILQFL